MHEHSKDSELTLGIYDILNKGEKGGMGALNIRSENRQFIGS